MTRTARRGLIAILGASALLTLPPAAMAQDPAPTTPPAPATPPATTPDPGQPSDCAARAQRTAGQNLVTYKFKAVYLGKSVFRITGGSENVRKGRFVGGRVVFDCACAQASVGDRDGDGNGWFTTDFRKGDRVVVRARLRPRSKYRDRFGTRKVHDKILPADRVTNKTKPAPPAAPAPAPVPFGS